MTPLITQAPETFNKLYNLVNPPPQWKSTPRGFVADFSADVEKRNAVVEAFKVRAADVSLIGSPV